MQLRRPLLVALLAATPSGPAAAASAANIKSPKLGAWVADNGGFNLQQGTGSNRGHVVLSNFHLQTAAEPGCPQPPASATVLGRFPLKVFTRGGYSVWGLGRNVKGEAEPVAARVQVGAQVYTGSFKMIWDYAHVTSLVLGGQIAFGECTVYMTFASPRQ